MFTSVMQRGLATTVGVLIVAAIILFGVASFYGLTSSFVSVEGLLIVIGGSVANAFLSYRRADVLTAFVTIRHLLKPEVPLHSPHKDIMLLIKWSYIVQARDLVGLEKESTEEIKDPLLRYGMDMVVTGYKPEKIREMMQNVADVEFERRCMPVTVLRNMAATAPSFGMVGTLIGMIILLKDVGSDISTIGSGLAIAMLSTLYGLLAARLVCLPAADKLLQQEEKERFRNYMLAEGLTMLSEKQSAFYIQDRLNSFLQPSRHFALDDYPQLALYRHFAVAA